MAFVKGDIDDFDLYETDPYYKELDQRIGSRKPRDFTLPKEEEECCGVGLGLLLLVDVLLIDTVDDNAYCLVDDMED